MSSFDAADPDFDTSHDNAPLGTLVFNDTSAVSNPYDGMTVQAILDDANLILGGGHGIADAATINEVVNDINMNFDNHVDNGFLTAP